MFYQELLNYKSNRTKGSQSNFNIQPTLTPVSRVVDPKPNGSMRNPIIRKVTNGVSENKMNIKSPANKHWDEARW